MLAAWDRYSSAAQGVLILWGAQTVLFALWHILLDIHTERDIYIYLCVCLWQIHAVFKAFIMSAQNIIE